MIGWSFGPYRNGWFLVPKTGVERDQNGDVLLDESSQQMKRHRLINSAQRINAVTIRDASPPLAVDEFSKQFVGYPAISLVDLFSGYDQWSSEKITRSHCLSHAIGVNEND